MDEPLPEQLKLYIDFCDLKNNALHSEKLDLENCQWLYPSTLLPLLAFMKEREKSLELVLPKRQGVRNYFYLIGGKVRPSVPSKTYVPLVELPHDESKAADTIGEIYRLNDDGKEYGGEKAFKYVIGELMDNIYQHSYFNEAFVMAQKYPSKKFVEICLFDDGITIPGSLNRAGMIYGDDKHAAAIVDAINGLSSKKDKERGFGLGSNFKLVTEGFKGEFLVVSGKGAVYLSEKKQNYLNFKKPIVLREP